MVINLVTSWIVLRLYKRQYSVVCAYNELLTVREELVPDMFQCGFSDWVLQL